MIINSVTMSKKITMLVMTLLLLPSVRIAAEKVLIDGIYYYIGSGGRCEVSESNISGDVVIPESINYAGITYSVSSIGYNAFSGCSGISSITIPSSVKSIGTSAFSGCSGLTSITIPSSVASIGYNAFQDCSGLKSIEIPNSVSIIGKYAFSGCSGFTSITIPSSVTTIGYYAFSYCSGLNVISVSPDNPKYDSRNNCNAIIETTSNTMIAACKNSVIPSSVPSIGIGAYSGCSGLTSVTIPSSVTSIDVSAFYDCSGLNVISVSPDNPKYDSRNDCNAIIETVSNTLIIGCKNSAIPSSVPSIGNGAFSGCSALTSITIPGTVTSIGNEAFSDCIGLTSIDIQKGVTSIGSKAFYGCSGLISVSLPGGVTRIALNAFDGCKSIKYCVFGCNSVIANIIPAEKIEKIKLTKDVTDFSTYCFSKAISLETIESQAINPPYLPIYFSYENINAIVPEGLLLTYLNSQWKAFLISTEGSNPIEDIDYFTPGNSIRLHLAGEQTVNIRVSDIRDITFSSDDMVFEVFSRDFNYSIGNVKYWDFDFFASTAITGIPDIESDVISISNDDNVLMLSGVKKNSIIRIFSIDGVNVINSKSDDNGGANISIDGFEKGVYILQTEGFTFKFAKL
jgi:hypothetical protein